MDYADTNFKGVPGPGRPKGSQNKIKAERQAKIETILNVADEMVQEALLQLKPKELLDIWVNLNEFLCPKMQRITLDTEPEDKQINKITFELVDSTGKSLDE